MAAGESLWHSIERYVLNLLRDGTAETEVSSEVTEWLRLLQEASNQGASTISSDLQRLTLWISAAKIDHHSTCTRLRKACQYVRAPKASTCNFDSNQPLAPSQLQDPVLDLGLLLPTANAHLFAALASNDKCDIDLAGFAPLIQTHALECLDHFFRCDEPWLKHPQVQTIMQRGAMSQVLGHSYILYGALAVSSAHLAFLRSDCRPYSTMSLVLWQKALRAYSPRLQEDLEPQNVDALFFASHLLSILASVNERFHWAREDCSWELPKWILSTRGVKTLWDIPSGIRRLRQGVWQSWAPLCELEYQRVLLDACAAVARSESQDPASPIICGLHARAYCVPGRQHIYEGRIALLGILERSKPSPEATMLVSWFVTRAPKEYIALLECGDEMALLLLLYWLRLASKVGQWWQSLAAAAESRRLCVHLSKCSLDRRMRVLIAKIMHV